MNTKKRFSIIQNESSGVIHKVDVLLMMILFIISGNPAMSFGLPNQPFYVAVAIIFFGLLFWRNIHITSTHAIGIFIFFSFILVYQSYAFSFFSVVTILGFLVRLFIAFAVVRLLKNFAKSYVDVIYALSLLSLLFYIPHQIGFFLNIDFASLFTPIEPLFGEPQGWRSTIFLHTFFNIRGFEHRNAGMFWEPGAFAGYLNIGIIFLAMVKHQYDLRAYWMRLIVLALCLLSTFSTTGYIAMPLALLLHMKIEISTKTSTILKTIAIIYLIALVFLIFYVFVWEQPFMKEKVLNSIFVTQYQKPGWEADRIGTLFFDYDYIKERPFTGWGLHGETRHALHPFLEGLAETGRGNGMSDFAAKMGVPALFLWMFGVFKYLFILSGNNLIRGGIGLLCIMIILNGECYLNYPLFLCFFFLYKELSLKQTDSAMDSVAGDQSLAKQPATLSSKI